MSLKRKEKALLHIYKNAAQLSDPDYRKLLYGSSGCYSAGDPHFPQDGFERAMATLETRLFERVYGGHVPDPIEDGNKWIRDEYYWRRKCPPSGRINSRQKWYIEKLWNDLVPFLPSADQSVSYFAGIVAKATGRTDIGITALTTADAWNVIEALKDRLQHAYRNHKAGRSAA